jgi:acyl-CoA thioester hydrolase
MVKRQSSVPPWASAEYLLELTVSEADVDALRHVNNIVYVRWLQDVAMAHSIAVGITHARLLEIGAVFVVRKHEIEYLRPGFLGERITLRTYVTWWKGASCERATRIERASDGVTLAKARTLWAFVTADTGRPTRIPAEVVEAFKRPTVPPGSP